MLGVFVNSHKVLNRLFLIHFFRLKKNYSTFVFHKIDFFKNLNLSFLSVI